MAPRQSARRKAAAATTEPKVEIKEVEQETKVVVAQTNGKKSRTIATTVVKKETKVQVKRKAEDEDEDEAELSDHCKKEKAKEEKVELQDIPEIKPAAKRQKTTKGKDQDTMPLAERTVVSTLKRAMYIGAHVSAAGGVQNSVENAAQIGANAFALFLKSQRKWANPPLAPDARDQFHSSCTKHSYDAAKHCLPHGSYLVNLAQPEKEKADQAYSNFVDDLKRCDELGIRLYNFHPGSALKDTKEAAIGRIAAQLNRSHKETKSVITVVENMAGSGNVVGSTFEDLRDIIELVEDKSRVGVCIDTCHAFAAGYDLRTPEAFKETFDEFDRIVGNKYLKAFHLNDSKAPFGSNRDLHANIGTGFLGLRAFHSVVNHAPFQDLPMVLETPIDKKDASGKTVEDRQVWADEIKLLESLIEMDAESDEFQKLAEKLQKSGAAERKRVQEQVDKKAEKDAKKAAPKGKAVKGRKKKAETDEDSE
ncbi:hypothetical protein MCOR27_004706 [Pyricularia oryzae]|nr:hypothetical protein MCOR01_002325 [Pyricularia oryzae]KAI6253412.1 hypothetical protein MCOR19_010024 [Pyricularia oryzae]KAI6269674.1 hypothetical protein MCOR26_008592 [Pyricularia oryzae]KAI6280286.1 hypothetical protein MCOR27_004706 [Pyricularia oryzae]KAI6306328.1 hypothetical protein MCOR29_010156 [Pyricularia oryzae]